MLSKLETRRLQSPQPIAPASRTTRNVSRTRREIEMTRLRRLALAVVVGVLVTLPTAGSALAGITFTAID